MHCELVQAGLLQSRSQNDRQENVTGGHRHPHAEDEGGDRSHQKQDKGVGAGDEYQLVDQGSGQTGGGKGPDDQSDPQQNGG